MSYGHQQNPYGPGYEERAEAYYREQAEQEHAQVDQVDKWTDTVLDGLRKLAAEFEGTEEHERELAVRRGIEEVVRLREGIAHYFEARGTPEDLYRPTEHVGYRFRGPDEKEWHWYPETDWPDMNVLRNKGWDVEPVYVEVGDG